MSHIFSNRQKLAPVIFVYVYLKCLWYLLFLLLLLLIMLIIIAIRTVFLPRPAKKMKVILSEAFLLIPMYILALNSKMTTIFPWNQINSQIQIFFSISFQKKNYWKFSQKQIWLLIWVTNILTRYILCVRCQKKLQKV